MANNRNLQYTLTAKDQSLGTTISKGADEAQKGSSKIAGAFSKAGSMIGGEFGEVLDKIGEGFDKLGEKGSTMAGKLTAGGAGLAGVGAVLTGLGSGEKQAQEQLSTAIDDTGASFSDYRDDVDKTISKQEDYAHSAKDTEGALSTLTEATQDPKKAIDEMGVTADLAAARHESLTVAAGQMAKVLEGSGSRTLKQYGIATSNVDTEVAQLSERLHGQAAASVDSWGGRLSVAKTKVEDMVGELGQKFGPALTIAGTVLTGAGAAAQLWASHVANATEAADDAEKISAAGSTDTAAEHVAASASVASASEASSASVVSAEAQASAAEEGSADNSQITAAQHVAASGEVGLAARAEAKAVISSDAQIIEADEAMGAAAVQSGEAAKGAKIGLLSFGVGLAAVGAAGYFAGNALSNWLTPLSEGDKVIFGLKNATDDLQTSLVNNANSAATAGHEWAIAELQSDGLAKSAAAAGITTDQLATAVTGGLGPLRQLVDQWKASGHISSDQEGALLLLAGAYGDTTTKLASLDKTTVDAAYSAESLAQAHKQGIVESDAYEQTQDSLRAATVAYNDQISRETALLTTLGQTQLANAKSEDAFKDSLNSVTSAVKTNGDSLSDNTAKGRANRGVIEDSLSAALSYAQAQKASGTAIGTVASNLAANVTQLERTAEKAGLSKKAVQELVAEMKLTPKDILTDFNIHVAANVALSTSTKGHGTAAAGGTVYSPGGRTLVGERGPEVVDLPRGSTVHPSSTGQSGSMAPNVTIAPGAFVFTLPPAGGNQREQGRAISGALSDFFGTDFPRLIQKAMRS